MTVTIWQLDIQLPHQCVVGLEKDFSRFMLFSSRPSKMQVLRTLNEELAVLVRQQAELYSQQSEYYSAFAACVGGDDGPAIELIGVAAPYYGTLQGRIEQSIHYFQSEVVTVKDAVRLKRTVIKAIDKTNWHLRTFGVVGESAPPVTLREIVALEEGECTEEFGEGSL